MSVSATDLSRVDAGIPASRPGGLAEAVPPAATETLGDRARRFVSDESGSSEVEYILLTALIVLPMSVLFFYLLVSSFAFYFGRVGWWINLPFP